MATLFLTPSDKEEVQREVQTTAIAQFTSTENTFTECSLARRRVEIAIRQCL